MTPSQYIQTSLENLQTQKAVAQPDSLEEEIYRLIMSKKFRKYSTTPALQEHIKEAIKLNVQKQQPIKITFLHGSYKLWRLDEAPYADWAELFAAMYYSQWLKPICEIYKPGVWFDFFVDDLIIPKLNHIELTDVEKYRKSFQAILDFLKQYQPENMRMTITGVGEQFDSPEVFYKKLQEDVAKYAKKFPTGLPEVTAERAATVKLNAKPTSEQTNDPHWLAKNVLMHDAYILLTKKETGYHLQPTKILAFAQPLPSGIALALGTTKTSVAKFWAGVGVLEQRGDTFANRILSPEQFQRVQKTNHKEVAIDFINLPNLKKIHVYPELNFSQNISIKR